VNVPEDVTIKAGPILRVAIREVIQNAIDHSDLEPSAVEISLDVSAVDERDVEITISDNGPGIEELEKIPVRGELESQLEHGSGIGLWMVNWVLTRLGGSLDIKQRDDRGTTLEMRLPRGETA
jgi:signal transduction histidine kinase